MLNVKKLLTKVLVNTKTINTALTVTTTNLSSSNWTANTASFTSGSITSFGKVRVAFLTVQLTSAYTAGTEYTAGTLKSLTGISFGYGAGVQVQGPATLSTTGVVKTTPAKNMSSGGNMYLTLVWIG